MQALWADGWFYISSAGLLVSGALFFFLLGQYRAAADAVDVNDASAEAEAEPKVSPVRPVFIPDEEPAPAAKVASVAQPAEAPVETPKAATPRENTTGGLSPAVVYLQNIQTHLHQLHGEIRGLSEKVNAVSSRDEALIERLGELAEAVAAMKSSAGAAESEPAPAPVPAPAPKRAKKAEAPAPAPAPAPEPAPAPATPPTVALEVKPEPAPAAQPAPEPAAEKTKASSPDETIRLELGAVIDEQMAAKTAKPAPAPEETAAAPAPAAQTPSQPAIPPEADEKPRRGPVWPV